MTLSKNVNDKKCAPKLIFSNEKNEKDSDDFWHRKLTLKVKFWHQLHQFSKFTNFLLSMLIVRQKSFQFCIPRLKTGQPVLPYFTTKIISIDTILMHKSFTEKIHFSNYPGNKLNYARYFFFRKWLSISRNNYV